MAPIITGKILHFRLHIRCISIHKLLYFSSLSASFCTTFLFAFIATLLLLLLLYYCYYSIVTLAAKVYVMSGCNKCCLNCTKSQGVWDHVIKYFTFKNQFTKPTSMLSIFILNTQSGQWDMALWLTSHEALRRNIFINMN